MSEPVNVIEPIRTSNVTAPIPNLPIETPRWIYSATPTRATASPPNEWESAIRSGILVIGIQRPMGTAITVTTSRPPMIHW